MLDHVVHEHFVLYCIPGLQRATHCKDNEAKECMIAALCFCLCTDIILLLNTFFLSLYCVSNNHYEIYFLTKIFLKFWRGDVMWSVLWLLETQNSIMAIRKHRGDSCLICNIVHIDILLRIVTYICSQFSRAFSFCMHAVADAHRTIYQESKTHITVLYAIFLFSPIYP